MSEAVILVAAKANVKDAIVADSWARLSVRLRKQDIKVLPALDQRRDPERQDFAAKLTRASALVIANMDYHSGESLTLDSNAREVAGLASESGLLMFADAPLSETEIEAIQDPMVYVIGGDTEIISKALNFQDAQAASQ